MRNTQLARRACALVSVATSRRRAHRRAVDRDDAVARLEARALGRACPATTSSISGGPRSAASPSSGIALPSQSAGLQRRERQHVRRARRRAIRAASTASATLSWPCALHEPPAQVLPAPHRLAVDAQRRGRPRGCPRAAAALSARRRRQQRALPGNARHVGAGEQQHREQQVGDRSGGDDRDALPDALAIERARQVRGGDVALALVGHLHVAAERNRRQRPFGAVAARSGARPDDCDRSRRKSAAP